MRLRALTDISRTARAGEEFDIADKAGEILIRDKEAEAVKAKAAPSTGGTGTTTGSNTSSSTTPPAPPAAGTKGGAKKGAPNPAAPTTPASGEQTPPADPSGESSTPTS